MSTNTENGSAEVGMILIFAAIVLMLLCYITGPAMVRIGSYISELVALYGG